MTLFSAYFYLFLCLAAWLKSIDARLPEHHRHHWLNYLPVLTYATRAGYFVAVELGFTVYL